MAVATSTALIGAAVAGAGASIYAGNKAASGAKYGAKNSVQAQMDMFNRSNQIMAPTMRIGYQAQRELAQLYGLDPDRLLPWERQDARRAASPRVGFIGGRPVFMGRGPGPGQVQPGARRRGGGDPIVHPRGPGDGLTRPQPKYENTPGGRRMLPDAGAPGQYPVGATAAGPPSFMPASEDPRLRNFFTSPGYNWRVGQGIVGLDRSAASRGGLFSGAQGKAITGFGQQMASDEYGRWLGGLQSLAGQGISAGGAAAGAGMQTGANLAGIYQNYGDARGQAYGDMAYGVNDAIQGSIANWLYNRGRS
jgi:hypothetical protein